MRAIASGSLGPFLAPTHLHTYCAPISVTKLHPEYTVGRFQMKRQLQGTVRGPKGLRSEEGFLLDSKRVQIELSLWTPNGGGAGLRASTGHCMEGLEACSCPLRRPLGTC